MKTLRRIANGGSGSILDGSREPKMEIPVFFV